MLPLFPTSVSLLRVMFLSTRISLLGSNLGNGKRKRGGRKQGEGGARRLCLGGARKLRAAVARPEVRWLRASAAERRVVTAVAMVNGAMEDTAWRREDSDSGTELAMVRLWRDEFRSGGTVRTRW
ncbi:FAD-dependent pyridine nucleotide-disulfide oxidoreductase [Sesbania bispinosa]|nr:FAD-dependent pyridine nucleotide-disulfide oxidoreductase [Sesbania bispinosa]